MGGFAELAEEAALALARVAAEGAVAAGPEEALLAVTRVLPALLGDRSAAAASGAFREPAPPPVGCAAAAFLRMPDGRHHLIAAPVNFPDEQRHELVDIGLGHPGEVAQTRRPLLLRDTALYPSFVKILQSFRAGSSVFTPLLWRDAYLGVIICANAARGTFGERDLVIQGAFAGLASALFIAHRGPAWLRRLNVSGRPVRTAGT